MHSSAAAGKEELDFLQGKIRIGLLNSKGGDQMSPSKSSGAIQSQQKQIEEPDLSDPFYEDAFGLNNLTESELGAHNVKSGGGTQQKQSTKSYADRVADGKPNFVVTINRRNEKRSQSGDGRTSKSSDLSYDDDKTFVTTSKLKVFVPIFLLSEWPLIIILSTQFFPFSSFRAFSENVRILIFHTRKFLFVLFCRKIHRLCSRWWLVS